MKFLYPLKRLLFIPVLMLAFCSSAFTQTTTLSTTATSTAFWSSAGGVLVFGVRNTNSYPIIIKELSSYIPASHNSTYTLWYHPTNVTGAPDAITTANGWIELPISSNVSGTGTAGVVPIFSNVGLQIPPGSTYRLGLVVSANGPYYGASGSSGTVFAAGGVEIFAQANPLSPTYAGPFPGPPTTTPRTFYGSITFEVASPCVTPPTAGTVVSSQSPVCAFSNFSLSLTGGTSGTGQTYQWQSSPDNTTWTNMPGGNTALLSTSQSTSTYYRAKVTCGGVTDSSAGLLVNTPALISGNFDINNGLPTGGNSFNSFAEAINHIKCGINGPVTFNVMPGAPYNGQIVIPPIAGASATNTVTFKGNMASIVHNTTVTTERAAIVLNGADYITIDSLMIDVSGGTFGWGIALTGQADSNRILNNQIVTVNNSTSTNYLGIAINGSATATATSGNNGNGNLIKNNTINGGYYGVYLYGASATPNNNNVIDSNIIIDPYLYGVYSIYQSGMVVRKNDISRPSRVIASATVVSYGIMLSTGVIGTLVVKNRIHNMFDANPNHTGAFYALYTSAAATAAAPNRFINNLVYNLGGNNPVYGIYNTTSPYMLAYHNTIALDGQSATTGGAYGFYQTGSATGIDFRNNLVYITRSGTGIKRALYFVTTTSGINSNRNVFYINPSGGTDNNLGQFGTTNYASLAAWQTANAGAYDQQSLTVDPVFFSPGSGDYTPMQTSFNGLGANVGVTDDILGNARGGSPDPGAYEITVAGTDAAITWISPVAGPTSPGLKTITVNIANTQTVTINSVSLSYTDGTAIVNQNFTGLNIAPGGSQQLSFTTQYNLATSSSLYAYINLVNGSTDNAQANDTTATRTLCVPMAGMYSINNGATTMGTNFATFAEAIQMLACGGVSGPVTFNITTGTYDERVVIPAITGASANNTITFKGNLATINFNSSATADRTAIILNGADHITLDSLIVDVSAGTFGWGIGLTAGADSNRIINCRIINNTTATTTNYAGIVINGSMSTTATSGNNGNYNIISNNTITGGYYGVYLYGSSTAGALNVGNQVSGNKVEDVYAYSLYAIYQSGALISKNDITRRTRTVSLSGAAGVFLTTGCINSLVEKNTIHSMFDGNTALTSTFYGIYVGADGTSGNENRIENNLIYDIAHEGIVYGIYNTGAAFMLAYHNTISLDNTSSAAGATYGFYQVTSDVGIQFKNNIVTITRGGSGVKYAIYKSTAATPLVSNHNVLYVNSAGSGAQGIGYQTSGHATLPDWQMASGQDSSSVSVDPMYFNAPGGNFEPTTSLVNNIGTPVGVLTDIRDTTRFLANPDPGAYEFTVLTAGLNVGAEGLVTPPASATGCYTNAEVVTIRIRNTSTSTHNFTNNPVTVTTTISGYVSQTLTAIVNTGTLQPDSTLEVVMSQPLDMSGAGTYTFGAYTTLAGDVNPANDAMLPVSRTKQVVSAGTASASPPTFCVPNPINPTLSTVGNTGYSDVHWVQSTTASGNYSAIGGANSASYMVQGALTQPMYYKLVATCGSAVDSSSVAAVAYSNPVVTDTTQGARCGAGSVTMQGTGSAGTTLSWYAAASGGSPLATGNSFTTNISSDTVFYVAASEGGISTNAAPIVVTEMDLGTTTDRLEIQNVSPNPVDVTGWKVAISDNYTNITAVNTIVQTLSGVMNPGEMKTWTDAAAGPNYWGSNILWNPAQQGWAAILDNNNNLVDIVFVDWPAATIQSASITINGTPVSPSTKWTGNGVSVTTAPDGQSVSRKGNMDNDNLTDFNIIPFTLGTTNPGLTLPFLGFGCSSARVPVTATITDCSVPVTLVNFKGNRNGAINKLEWQTATEADNVGFELQRSADGNNFSQLSYIPTKAVNGNSTSMVHYGFDDVKPLAGNSYYRLKQVDKNGKYSYSQIVLIKGAKVNMVTISSIYPNPSKNELNLVMTAPATAQVTLLVTDISGKQVMQQPAVLAAGDNQLQLKVNKLASGIYIIKAVCATGCESIVHKFIKQ